jgi:hypothetical protein
MLYSDPEDAARVLAPINEVEFAESGTASEGETGMEQSDD